MKKPSTQTFGLGYIIDHKWSISAIAVWMAFLIAGVALTVISVSRACEEDALQTRANFEAYTSQLVFEFASSVASHLQAAYLLSALAEPPEVARTAMFDHNRVMLEVSPLAAWLVVAPVILAANRTNFERSVSLRMRPNFTITERAPAGGGLQTAALRQCYAPIIAGWKNANERLPRTDEGIGFDVTTLPSFQPLQAAQMLMLRTNFTPGSLPVSQHIIVTKASDHTDTSHYTLVGTNLVSAVVEYAHRARSDVEVYDVTDAFPRAVQAGMADNSTGIDYIRTFTQNLVNDAQGDGSQAVFLMGGFAATVPLARDADALVGVRQWVSGARYSNGHTTSHITEPTAVTPASLLEKHLVLCGGRALLLQFSAVDHTFFQSSAACNNVAWIGSLVTVAVCFVYAGFGIALRTWARRAQERTRSAAHLLEVAKAAHERTLDWVYHQVRNPLSVMMQAGELLIDAIPKNIAAHKDAQLIVKNGDHLSRLLDDLNDFNSLIAGKVILQCRQFSLRDMVGQLAASHKYYTRVPIVWEVDADVPDTMHSDNLRLLQVLSNGLTNACRVAVQSAVHITVAAAQNDRVVFSIVNRGPGLGGRTEQDLFAPFSLDLWLHGRLHAGEGSHMPSDARKKHVLTAPAARLRPLLPFASIGEDPDVQMDDMAHAHARASLKYGSEGLSAATRASIDDAAMHAVGRRDSSTPRSAIKVLDDAHVKSTCFINDAPNVEAKTTRNVGANPVISRQAKVGLGLPVCKMLVELLHGTICLFDEPGDAWGNHQEMLTTFQVVVPLDLLHVASAADWPAAHCNSVVVAADSSASSARWGRSIRGEVVPVVRSRTIRQPTNNYPVTAGYHVERPSALSDGDPGVERQTGMSALSTHDVCLPSAMEEEPKGGGSSDDNEDHPCARTANLRLHEATGVDRVHEGVWSPVSPALRLQYSEDGNGITPFSYRSPMSVGSSPSAPTSLQWIAAPTESITPPSHQLTMPSRSLTHNQSCEAYQTQLGKPCYLSLHVLVVDDEKAIRMLLQRMLLKLGCTSECVEDGSLVEGVLSERGQLRGSPPATPGRKFDVILMDIVMNHSDGAVVTARLVHDLGCALPVIAVTGNGRDRALLSSAGFRDVVTKPFSMAALEKALNPIGLPGLAEETSRVITDSSIA